MLNSHFTCRNITVTLNQIVDETRTKQVSSEVLGFRDLEYLVHKSKSEDINKFILQQCNIAVQEDNRRKRKTFKLSVKKDDWETPSDSLQIDESSLANGMLKEYSEDKEVDGMQFRVKIRYISFLSRFSNQPSQIPLH